MKAVVLTEPNCLEERELETPRAGGGRALVRITHSGICGTDAKIYSGAIPSSPPVVMGHEFVGEIIEGKAPGGEGPGTRVLVDPVLYCGTCFFCRKGQTYLCPDGTLMGREENGGFAEYAIPPEAHLHPLPDEISDRDAPLIQVLTTVLHAFNLTKVEPGESTAILGLGVTGLLQVQIAKALGARPVIGISRNAHKRKLAQKLGADVVAPHGEEAKAAVLGATEGRGADIVVESVGHLTVLAEAMELARTGGRIIPFGIYGARQAELPFYEFYFKELNLIGARAARPEDFPASIELVRNGTVKLDPLITHELPFTDLADAIQLLLAPSDERLKIILRNG